MGTNKKQRTQELRYSQAIAIINKHVVEKLQDLEFYKLIRDGIIIQESEVDNGCENPIK